jgi:hypothetical protein
MQLNTLCLFNLLLALSLLFTFTSALPYRSRVDDATPTPSPREMPSRRRLHARSFDVDADNAPTHAHIYSHLKRHSLPTPAPTTEDEYGHGLAGREPVPTMENSLKGNTKVYVGNYW